MIDKNQELVTPEGLEKLQLELAYLTETRRKEVADRIRQAREFGDISENSEYDEAKNEQGLLERRIGELQRRVRNVKVIDPSEVEDDEVDLGTTVTLRVVGREGQERTFQIVGSNESDPTSGKLRRRAEASFQRTDLGTYSVERFCQLTGYALALTTGVREAECTALRRRWGKDSVRGR